MSVDKKFEVVINRMEPINRMGRVSVPFQINLSHEGFERFLNAVPRSQRKFYEDRAEALGAPVVEVTLPEDACPDEFHLFQEKEAVEEMYNNAISSHMFAAADILHNVRKVVA